MDSCNLIKNRKVFHMKNGITETDYEKILKTRNLFSFQFVSLRFFRFSIEFR